LRMFPEAEVNSSADVRLASFQTGIGLLAQNLALPVVPMRLDGVWQMKREHHRLARIGAITIHIGAPITFSPDMPASEIAHHLECAVRSLSRSVYPAFPSIISSLWLSHFAPLP